jgi:hypothetical protein
MGTGGVQKWYSRNVPVTDIQMSDKPELKHRAGWLRGTDSAGLQGAWATGKVYRQSIRQGKVYKELQIYRQRGQDGKSTNRNYRLYTTGNRGHTLAKRQWSWNSLENAWNFFFSYFPFLTHFNHFSFAIFKTYSWNKGNQGEIRWFKLFKNIDVFLM